MSERKLKKMDSPMLTLTLLLVIIGLIMLFSASYVLALETEATPYYYVIRQGGFALLGLVIMYMLSHIDYHIYHRFAWLLYFGVIVLLIMVLAFGVERNFAKRWLVLAGIQFQPSEIAKTAIIILFSSLAVKRQKVIKEFGRGLCVYLALIGIIAALMLLQPHLSATIIIAVTGIGIIFVGGSSIFQLLAIIGAGCVGVAGFILAKSYALTRLKVWLDPFIDATGKGWQAAQSFIAIGSGGLFGLGFGQSVQKHLFLPEPANDFIFPVICEELGFVGGLFIVLLFAVFVLRGFSIASKSKDKFGMLLAVGITTKVAIQTLVNLFVVTGVIPVTGAALPFFSYGGTALVIQLCEIGVLLNISRQNKLI